MFRIFPWSNLHDLNLDWIVSKIKNVEDAEKHTEEYAYNASQSASQASLDASSAQISATNASISASNAEQSAQSIPQALEQLELTNARLDTIIPDGQQTEGNTELIDIRTWYDGRSSATAGDAVRGQTSELKSDIVDISDNDIKNLAWLTDTTNRTVNGLALTFNDDGSIGIRGHTTALTVLYMRGVTSNRTNLPAGTYTFSRETISGSGNVRITNNGTNIVSSASVEKVSVTQTLETEGQIYLSIGNNVDVNGVFRFQIEKGSEATDYSVPYKASALDHIARDDIKKLLKADEIAFRFISTTATQGGTDRIQVLINNIRYDMVHSIVPETNCDTWRMLTAQASNNDFAFIKQLTGSGEWECAVRLSGRDDFSGGYLHGDEVMTSFNAFIDNAWIRDITLLTNIQKCKELRIVVTSLLYDPSNHSRVIANHGREYIFNKDGLTINQSIIWAVNETLDRCYLAMFPASKTVFSNYYVNSEFITHELNESSYSYEKKHASDAVIKGNGVFSEFSVSKYENFVGGDTFLITDNNGNNYHKCYYRVCDGGSVENGDIWTTTTKYTIKTY